MGIGIRLVTGALTVALAAAGYATPDDDWTLVPGGYVSGDVSHLKTIATEAGGAVDATVHDERLYVTSWRSFSIYDVSDAREPALLSMTPLVVGVYNEQPQTNGDILLLSRDIQYLPPTEQVRGGGVLDIYDVRDPEAPVLLATWKSRLVGTFATHRDHLWTCVLDCSYAYSAGGTILDLRDPSTPTYVGLWTDVAPPDDGHIHHVGEVTPGLVLTGSIPMYVLDASDPASPSVITSFAPRTVPTGPLVGDPVTVPNPVANPEGLPARSSWPGGLDGGLAVVSIETPFTGSCTDASGDVQTFTVTRDEDDPSAPPVFEPAGAFALRDNGTYDQGAPPYNVFGCGAYGLRTHPAFGDDGGAVAVAFFEHGVRVLEVDADGAIASRGGFIPIGGNTTTPGWLSDDVLFVTDLHRGVDLLAVAADD